MLSTFKHSLVSGLGDYILGLNRALFISEYLGLQYVHFPSRVAERVGHPEIDEFIGLSALRSESVDFAEFHSLSISEAYELIASKSEFPSGNILFFFDSNDYCATPPAELLREISKTPGNVHPLLVWSLQNSRLGHIASSIRRSLPNRRIVSVHVRRGDVALADLSRLRSLGNNFKPGFDYYYTHNDQFFNKADNIFDKFPQSYRYSNVSSLLMP